MKDVFKKLITDFHQHRLHPTIPRDMHIPFHSGKIISLVGVRRSGKTSIQSIDHHLAALEMASHHLKQGRLDRIKITLSFSFDFIYQQKSPIRNS